MKITDLVSICHGALVLEGDNCRVSTLLTDSRKIVHLPGAVFFAIQGRHHDGHDYLPELFEARLRNFVVEREVAVPVPAHTNLVRVDSSLKAIQQLAEAKRKDFPGRVIGITGSNGKTIVKEWLSKMLDHRYTVIRSPRSYNSQLGVPLSVWELQEFHDIGVFEAGISRPGEMEKLQRIIRPTHGILTNIGTAHEDGFPSMESKLQEKLKLFEGIDLLIHRADDPMIAAAIEKMAFPPQKILTWAFGGNPAVKVVRVDRQRYRFLHKDRTFELTLPFTEAAFVENLIHCICFLYIDGYSIPDIQAYLSELDAVPMRLKVNKGIDQTYIIDDSYNNDLAGLATALDFLFHQRYYQKKTLILSDILHTSDKNEAYSRVNWLLHEKEVHRLIGIGPELSRHRSLFDLPAVFFQSTDDFLEHLGEMTFEKEVILIKGARDFTFERITRRLTEKAHQTVLEIDLEALTHNLNFFRRQLRPNVKLMVMVKALAYGSGPAEIAHLLQFHKVDYLAVAYADEGVALRKNGIRLPIMVLNTTPSDQDNMIRYRLEPEIYSMEQLVSFSRYYRSRDEELPVHINLNTGMNRLGFEPEETERLAAFIRTDKTVVVKSLFTHLAGADEAAHTGFSHHQLTTFQDLAEKIESTLRITTIKHALNSAGILRFPEYQMDMVRLGIGLYGMAVNALTGGQLRPIGTLKSIISQLRLVKKGDTVGYGRKGAARSDTKVATLPIGYADGFSRALGNGVGVVRIHGKPARVIGDVCMDMTMVDVTHIDAKVGDEVIIFGEDPTIDALAQRIGTIPYELITGISERVKRIYHTG